MADCKLALAAVKSELEKTVESVDFADIRETWQRRIARWKREHPLRYEPGEHGVVKPQAVVEAIHELVDEMRGGDAIISTEVGQNQMWAAQFFGFEKPRTFLSSGGLGTMGYGFPAAIGAQMAYPDKLVIDIAGDGSIQMNIQELATAVCNKLPVKIVILNNAYLGMVRQWQELFYKENYCETCMDAQPDFVLLAEAYGAGGYRVDKTSEVKDVLRRAFEDPRPVIVDVRVCREENVYPMVPAGKSLTEMLLV